MIQDELGAVAREFLMAIKLEADKYTSHESQLVKDDLDYVLLSPSHIQFARYGRGPGKAPPLDRMLAWVSKKGIIFKGTDERGTAFAIMKSISKNGTKNFTPNAPNFLETEIEKNMKKFNDGIGQIMLINSEKVMEDQIEQSIPKVWTIKV